MWGPALIIDSALSTLRDQYIKSRFSEAIQQAKSSDAHSSTINYIAGS